jgi:hypothetical protein
MIKEAGIVREPRGISWQNWVATCKDAMVTNGKYLAIVLLVVVATIAGTLYVKGTSSGNLSNQGPSSGAQPKQNNLSAPSEAQPTTPAQSESGSSDAGAGANTSTKPYSRTTAQPNSNSAVCDVGARTAATLQYETNLSLENTYHTTQLTLLGVTGTVTSLLGSPNSAKIKAENTRHQNVLTSLQTTLDNKLAAASCL